jgi:hypothetical protein
MLLVHFLTFSFQAGYASSAQSKTGAAKQFVLGQGLLRERVSAAPSIRRRTLFEIPLNWKSILRIASICAGDAPRQNREDRHGMQYLRHFSSPKGVAYIGGIRLENTRN